MVDPINTSNKDLLTFLPLLIKTGAEKKEAKRGSKTLLRLVSFFLHQSLTGRPGTRNL
jgi:hypothetical protein